MNRQTHTNEREMGSAVKPRSVVRVRATAQAFTLMEVLITIGIFGIGLIAIAAIFPTAIAVQRQTVNDQLGQAVAVNAEAVVTAIARSKGIMTYKHDPEFANRDGTLKPYSQGGWVRSMLALSQVASPNPLNSHFTLAIRSYPSHDVDPDKRDFFWYPFLQVNLSSSTDSIWFGYVIVVRRAGQARVPEILQVQVGVEEDLGAPSRIRFTSPRSVLDNDKDDNGIPDLISPGDWVLGDDGGIHRVVLADRDGITVDTPAVQVGLLPLRSLFYGVGLNPDGTVRREVRSPIVRIEGPFSILPQTFP